MNDGKAPTPSVHHFAKASLTLTRTMCISMFATVMNLRIRTRPEHELYEDHTVSGCLVRGKLNLISSKWIALKGIEWDIKALVYLQIIQIKF